MQRWAACLPFFVQALAVQTRTRFHALPLEFTIGGVNQQVAQLWLQQAENSNWVLQGSRGRNASKLGLYYNDALLLQFIEPYRVNQTHAVAHQRHKMHQMAAARKTRQVEQQNSRSQTGDGYISFERSFVSVEATKTASEMSLKTIQSNASLYMSVAPKVRGLRQWSLWALHTFQNSDHGWSVEPTGSISNADYRQSCMRNPDLFLGGPCLFSSHTASVSLSDLPKHKLLRIRARVHLIDKWQGESMMLRVDGKIVWSMSHRHCVRVFTSGCRIFSVCGSDQYSDTLSAAVDITLPHNTGSLDLAFSSTLPQGHECVASWGVDDVAVSYL